MAVGFRPGREMKYDKDAKGFEMTERVGKFFDGVMICNGCGAVIQETFHEQHEHDHGICGECGHWCAIYVHGKVLDRIKESLRTTGRFEVGGILTQRAASANEKKRWGKGF